MILRTLKRQQMHGYALVQQIKRTSNDVIETEDGSLYPALQRLLKDGFVKAQWSVPSYFPAHFSSGFSVLCPGSPCDACLIRL